MGMDRGEFEFSFFKIFFIAGFIAFAWFVMEWSISLYTDASIQSKITATVLEQKIRLDLSKLTSELQERLPRLGPVTFGEDDLKVEAAEDVKKVRVDLRYIYHAKIPFTGKTIDLPKHIQTEESLDLRR